MSVEQHAHTPPRPFSTRLFLLVVVSAVFVTTMTGSMINVLIPIMRTEFGASAADIGWIITGYTLAYAIGVPLYGRISDVYGVRQVFTLGLLGFAVGGLICAFAPNLLVLIVGRTVQGIGGAAVPALATVSVAKVLPASERGTGMGLVASMVGTGGSVGPIIGGTVGQVLGWRALFIASLSLMLLLIPFAQRVLPNAPAITRSRFDLLGGILLGLTVGLLLFGTSQGQVAGFAAWSAWGCLLLSVVALAAFVWRITSVDEPFVSPQLFASSGYVGAMLVGFLSMFANMSVLVFVSLLAVEVNQLSPSAAGLMLTPGAATLALLSPFAGRFSDRIGVRPLIRLGLITMIAGLLTLSTFAGGSPAVLAIGVALMGVGMACIQSPTNSAAASALPPEQLGGGMGIFSGSSFLGASAGPALAGAFLAARQTMDSLALNPLHAFAGTAFSDLFLVAAVAPALGLLCTLLLKARRVVPAPAST